MISSLEARFSPYKSRDVGVPFKRRIVVTEQVLLRLKYLLAGPHLFTSPASPYRPASLAISTHLHGLGPMPRL